MNQLLEQATRYQKNGLCVLPADKQSKCPTLDGWKDFQERTSTADEVNRWFATGGSNGMCIICGKVSGNFEVIDFDQKGAMFEPWLKLVSQQLDLSSLGVVQEATQSGGTHIMYRCDNPVSKNMKLAQRSVNGKPQTFIETRGEGGLIVCAPTIGYAIVHGDLGKIGTITSRERDILIQSAVALNEFIHPVPKYKAYGPTSWRGNQSNLIADKFNEECDTEELLMSHGWTRCGQNAVNTVWRRPGKNMGQSATLAHSGPSKGILYCFSTNAYPINEGGNSPFGVYAALIHNGDYAAAFRSLETEYRMAGNEPAHGIDLSLIMQACNDNIVVTTPKAAPLEYAKADVPDELCTMPGLVEDIIQYIMHHSPYPRRKLAFCSAIALMAHIVGRKVMTQSGLNPNLYIMALASSGSGKEAPRQAVRHIMASASGDEECEMANGVYSKPASGAGIEDALLRTPNMIMVVDEMDGLVRSMADVTQIHLANTMADLLHMYTCTGTYPLRLKSGDSKTSVVHDPCVSMLGFAIPKFFYESMSEQMLVNGLFSRMFIFDIGIGNRTAHESTAMSEVPASIIKRVQYWRNEFGYNGSKGNLQGHQEKYATRIPIPFSEGADKVLKSFRAEVDDKWNHFDKEQDEVSKTAWTRAHEKVLKLCLLYACSKSHTETIIETDAVEWSMELVSHQIKRQLNMAKTHQYQNKYDAGLKKLLKFILDYNQKRGKLCPRGTVQKHMACKAADLSEMIQTLVVSEEIEVVKVDNTGGRPAFMYRAKEQESEA